MGEMKHINEIPTIDELGEAVDEPEEMRKEKERPRFEMTEVYLFATKDDNGDEGVVAVVTSNGQLVPLISFDPKKTEQMMPSAQQVANESGKTVTVVHLFNREELGVIEPKKIQVAPAGMSMSADNLKTKE